MSTRKWITLLAVIGASGLFSLVLYEQTRSQHRQAAALERIAEERDRCDERLWAGRECFRQQEMLLKELAAAQGQLFVCLKGTDGGVLRRDGGLQVECTELIGGEGSR